LKLNEAIKETTITDKVINLTPKYLYVIAVEGPSTFYNKNKEIRFTNIEIDRMDSVELSKGIANLNVKKNT